MDIAGFVEVNELVDVNKNFHRACCRPFGISPRVGIAPPHDYCPAVFFRQGKKQCRDRAGVTGVQIAGGVVGQDQRRIIGRRQRHCDALLFAAGQFLWPLVA